MAHVRRNRIYHNRGPRVQTTTDSRRGFDEQSLFPQDCLIHYLVVSNFDHLLDRLGERRYIQ